MVRMNALTPYLNFPGNCREAVTFYKECFDAELHITTFGDMNPATPEAQKDAVMHALVRNGAAVLMASDAQFAGFVAGTNVSVSIHPASLEEADRLWAALSVGANIRQPLADAPWGARFGMLTDKFGIHWMLNYEYPKQ
jgi:PhnB protein